MAEKAFITELYVLPSVLPGETTFVSYDLNDGHCLAS